MDLKYPERFATKLRELLALHNHVLKTFLHSAELAWDEKIAGYMKDGEIQFDAVYDEAMHQAELIKPMIARRTAWRRPRSRHLLRAMRRSQKPKGRSGS